MARLTFEYENVDPVIINLSQEKAALIVNEFIEAQNGPTDGTSQEKLLFFVAKIREFVIQNAQANYVRKAAEEAKAEAEAVATDLLSV